jgi:hypothetical protein
MGFCSINAQDVKVLMKGQKALGTVLPAYCYYVIIVRGNCVPWEANGETAEKAFRSGRFEFKFQLCRLIARYDLEQVAALGTPASSSVGNGVTMESKGERVCPHLAQGSSRCLLLSPEVPVLYIAVHSQKSLGHRCGPITLVPRKLFESVNRHGSWQHVIYLIVICAGFAGSVAPATLQHSSAL